MARTTFSGPVKSDNGFEGDITSTNLTASGTVTFSGLPTSDPGVAGQVYVNGGNLVVSAG
jgi:hypothetical protein